MLTRAIRICKGLTGSNARAKFLSLSMAEKIRRKLSPVDLVNSHLARSAEMNPRLNAFVEVCAESAQRQAQAAEAAIGNGAPLGPLHGVPLSIKSSIEVTGLRWETGSKTRADFLGAQDAPLVRRLRQAGAIILGSTNAPEMLMAWETDNLLYGRTNNPWDVWRTPGGSSGEEAAAIAYGMSAGGVGSDGSGSIRATEHISRLSKLKATGRIPRHFPASTGPFALLGVVGPMARTVADLKVLFEVMQGPDDGDPSAAPVPVRWPTKNDLKGIRVGYFEDDGRTPVTAETRTAIRTAAEALRQAGFQVELFRPEGLDLSRQLWWKIFGIAGGMLLGPMIRGREECFAKNILCMGGGRTMSHRQVPA
jgi:Asp-tRNA(Asn)/Glu-tRNA(Gln) amidotransferase A subunit family amidase